MHDSSKNKKSITKSENMMEKETYEITIIHAMFLADNFYIKSLPSQKFNARDDEIDLTALI